jgi:hypothetical protein
MTKAGGGATTLAIEWPVTSYTSSCALRFAIATTLHDKANVLKSGQMRNLAIPSY